MNLVALASTYYCTLLLFTHFFCIVSALTDLSSTMSHLLPTRIIGIPWSPVVSWNTSTHLFTLLNDSQFVTSNTIIQQSLPLQNEVHRLQNLSYPAVSQSQRFNSIPLQRGVGKSPKVMTFFQNSAPIVGFDY
ncbi:UNKNOWN [Stylonychia lemnae]|uniref:Uncharacterized protein n=1 Tax=Stylonychia lemnae TaxID=5949 RepID=A0A078A4M2_STYLE|nr:UNKNOWN [Stylonychia lemnae]|eukprot:CDW76448.1 UNKNOWN [Stylonychia lemnae]